MSRIRTARFLAPAILLLAAGPALAAHDDTPPACPSAAACLVGVHATATCGQLATVDSDDRATDGALYESWRAPEFELPQSAGPMLSLHALRGSHVVLTLLSADCAGSAATLGVIETLRNRFAGADLVFVPVFVANGDVETLNERIADWEIPFPVVVSEDEAIGQAYATHVVPAAFFIGTDGRVRRKLVGLKDEATLDAAVAELLADSYPPAPID